MSNFNPVNQIVDDLEKKISKLNSSCKELKDNMLWYTNNSEASFRNMFNEIRSRNDQLYTKRAEIDGKIDLLTQKIADITSKIRTRLNPKNWFDHDQIALRRDRRELEETLKKAKQDRIDTTVEIEKNDEKAKSTDNLLKRYRAFDLPQHKLSYKSAREQLTSLRKRLDKAEKKQRDVDSALKPVIAQIKEYEKLKKNAERKLRRAQSLDEDLENASNSYERAQVHQQCESEFNHGSPRKVIAESERELRQINRDYEKARDRANDIGRKAARVIEAIIVDGINLCYDNKNFIGLSALEVIIPLLQNDYEVTVVFDAAIGSMVKLSTDSIDRKLGQKARIHVMSPGGKADETVLNLAERDNHTYVLSNDRFGEYNDKRAIREKRILRHEIINRHIMIHDLGIDRTF